MKKILLPLLLMTTVFACKKDDLVKTVSYVDLVYEITNNEDTLDVEYYIGVYNDTQKGNIKFDTVLTQQGVHFIPGRVLAGENVQLYAYSEKGGDFHLRIKADDGSTLAETDTVTFSPANQLHPDYWTSKLVIVP